jgi:3-methylcrotonyl-CoA carboxylase beta subunit
VSIIESRIHRTSADFVANAAVNRGLAADLRVLIDKVRAGGSASARTQHESRGKMFVRDRIDRLR